MKKSHGGFWPLQTKRALCLGHRCRGPGRQRALGMCSFETRKASSFRISKAFVAEHMDRCLPGTEVMSSVMTRGDNDSGDSRHHLVRRCDGNVTTAMVGHACAPGACVRPERQHREERGRHRARRPTQSSPRCRSGVSSGLHGWGCGPGSPGPGSPISLLVQSPGSNPTV